MARPLPGTVRSTVAVLFVFSMLLWTALMAAIAANHYSQHKEIAAAIARIVACEIYGPAGPVEFVSIPWTPIERLTSSCAKTDMFYYAVVWLLGVTGLTGASVILARKNREQENMQRQLVETNEKIAAILESINDAFFSLDHDLVIQYCNSAAEIAFGKAKGECVGKHFFDALPCFRGTTFEECLLRAQREKAGRAFETVAGEGSSENWFAVNVYPREDGMTVCLRVITEQKKTEKALKENEALLSLILDTSPAATAMTVNRIVKWVNDAWVKMFGFADKREPIGVDSRALYPDEDNYQRVGKLYERLSDGAVARTEAVMKRKDGSTFEAVIYFKAVDPQDLSKGVISAILDISEVKEAQRQVAVGEKKFERALNGAELGWWSLDLQAKHADRNERYAKMLGYSLEEIEPTRNGWEKLVHPEDMQRVMAAFDEHLEGKSSLYESEYRMKTKDGGWKWVLDRGKVLERDGQGKPLRVAGTILDISYRKKLEQEGIEMQRKVLEAQRLESLSLMAGGIAHQFNNLLQIVMGNLELLQMNKLVDGRAAGFVDAAFRAARRAAKLSGLMLDYTGQTLYMPRDVDVNEIVARGEQLFSSVAPRTARFVIERGEVRHAVSGDAAQLEQVIMSLVTNAAEAVGDGPGEIRLTTGEMECDEAYLATTRRELHPAPGRYVFIEVSDTGHGMNAGALERIFDPFYTTKFMGRGLGMAAVLGIVRGHKGGIRIDSEPGKGTAVRVLLPAGPELKEAGAPPEAPHEKPEARLAATKVLMVDDDETVLQLGRDLLDALGYDGLTAASGEEAIRLCTEPGNAIGCVILDISMPKMDGVQTLRELKRHRPDLKIIISSGFPEAEARLIIGAVDVAGFLTKPYDLETFQAALAKAHGEHNA
ncbi:MAG: PAS domain S-box protein [Desulfomonilaceae bacterium]